LNTQKAYIHGYIDWNNNGSFGDAGEFVAEAVPAGTPLGFFPLSFTIPFGAHVASPVGARFRISTMATMSSIDGAPDGEVEDYLVQVKQLDLGDLPDITTGIGPGDYQTLVANNGPRHILVPELYMANDTAAPDTDIDADADGQPNPDATGDDDDGNNDDLALSLSIVAQHLIPGPNGEFAGTMEIAFSQAVTNTTGAPATLYLFADSSGDGDFADTGEQTSMAIPNGSVEAPSILTPVFDLEDFRPGINRVAARFRLTTDANPGPTGLASNGEVCDYVEEFTIVIDPVTYDLGSLPDPSPGTGPGDYQTSLANGGASHWRHPELRIGAHNHMVIFAPPAGEGLTLPAVLHRRQVATFSLSCRNQSGVQGYLHGFADWNRDGDFLDAYETLSVPVNHGEVDVVKSLNFPVPATAVPNQPIGVRFRISQDATLGANGHSKYGEVEDALVTVTLTPAEIAWESWLDSFGLVDGDRDPDADPENDGRPNIEEYATGGVPVPGEFLPSIPILELVEDAGQTWAELVYLERRGVGLGLSYFPMFSPELEFMPLSVWAEESRLANPPDAPGYDRVRARLSVPVDDLTPRQFARVLFMLTL
jgi:large repetitive protein